MAASKVQQRFHGRCRGTRPWGIDDRDWDAFVAYIRDGVSFRALGEQMGVSGPRAFAVINRVAGIVDRENRRWGRS